MSARREPHAARGSPHRHLAYPSHRGHAGREKRAEPGAAGQTRRGNASSVRLVVSVLFAHTEPAWFVRATLSNALRFTAPPTLVAVHMDAARKPPRTRDEWGWLASAPFAPRVKLTPRPVATQRKAGSLLYAHILNWEHARTVAPKSTHFLFTASNCWFFRPGIEGYVAERQATLGLRACTAGVYRPTKAHCTAEAWFTRFNFGQPTLRRMNLEGQFYPHPFVAEMVARLRSMDANGRPRGAASSARLF